MQEASEFKPVETALATELNHNVYEPLVKETQTYFKFVINESNSV